MVYWSQYFTIVGSFSVYLQSDQFLYGDPPDTYSPFQSVTKSFTVQEPPVTYYDLTIAHTGSGTMYPYEGTKIQMEGQTVEVTARANTGWAVNYWLLDEVNVGSGTHAAGQDWTYTVTMNTGHHIVAVFYQPVYTLTVNTVGPGLVTKSPNQA